MGKIREYLLEQKKPAKGARKIVVDNRNYYWLYKGSKIVIWDEKGKKHLYDDSDATGWSNDAIERGKWKKYFSITPSFIADFIRKEKI